MEREARMVTDASELLHPRGLYGPVGVGRGKVTGWSGCGSAVPLPVRSGPESGIPERIYCKDADGRTKHGQQAEETDVGGGCADVPESWNACCMDQTAKDGMEGAAVCESVVSVMEKHRLTQIYAE